MNLKSVYDLPTRFFHWSFGGLFVGAFVIAKTFDDDSAQYPYHKILGLTLAFAVVLRILWGVVGSRYAKFSSFALRPTELFHYFKNFFDLNAKRYWGHNPASSWAALTMMCLALGLALTGFLMSQDINKDFFEDIHEVLSYVFVTIAGLHILGVIIHTIRHKDPIGMSMIHGKKQVTAEEAAVVAGHPFVALIFLVLVVIFGANLVKNYDPTTGKLQVYGLTLQLGDD